MSAIDRYTCEDVFRKLDDYLDRNLTVDEIRLVREHLQTCERCTSEVAFEESVLHQVREKVQRLAAPSDLLARVNAALARERERGGSSGA